MRAGIFGGTFDPVHIGHIKMAEYAVENFNLDKVIFVPNANPPHKKGKKIEDYRHRYNMLKIAVGKKRDFCVSDYESAQGRYYYSLYTMRHFRELLGDDVFFIIGADSLTTIHEWYEYEKLLAENKFIVFLRKNDDKDVFEHCEKKYRAAGADISVAKMPEVDVSSTDIRKRLLKGQSVSGVLDADVYRYIKDNGLYGETK